MREGPFRRPLSFLWEAALGTVLNSAPALERPLLSEDASLTANEPARRTVDVSRCSEASVNAGISRPSLQTDRLPTAFRAPTGPMTDAIRGRRLNSAWEAESARRLPTAFRPSPKHLPTVAGHLLSTICAVASTPTP